MSFLRAAFLLTLLSACAKEPTSVSEARFDEMHMVFEVQTFEAGGPANNSHTVYARGIADKDSDKEMVFHGIGGDIPQISHAGANNFLISYDDGIWYEVWTEKRILINAQGKSQLRTILLKVK